MDGVFRRKSDRPYGEVSIGLFRIGATRDHSRTGKIPASSPTPLRIGQETTFEGSVGPGPITRRSVGDRRVEAQRRCERCRVGLEEMRSAGDGVDRLLRRGVAGKLRGHARVGPVERVHDRRQRVVGNRCVGHDAEVQSQP